MRLRCPHQGCLIEVADDMLGARIRCPHCDELLFVEDGLQVDGSSPPPFESAPSRSGAPENQVYAGPPPLSVMLAVRAGRPGGKVDQEIRALMTEDDWKALAAFESVLNAVSSLQTACWLGILAVVISVLAWIAAAEPDFARYSPPSPQAWFTALASLAVFVAGLALMEIGRRHVRNLQTGLLAEAAALAALGVALAFGVTMVAGLVRLFGSTYDVTGLFTVPFCLTASASAAVSFLRLQQTLSALKPPEILHRLSEAFAYLA